MAGGELICSGKAELGELLFQAQFPFLVIGAGEINGWRYLLAGKTSVVHAPDARIEHRPTERERAGLPLFVKHGLVLLRLDFAETVHAAHVVDAIHHTTSPGCFGNPVPIMQSRVTRLASFPSLQFSVPLGRIGRTIKRVSAVESQTRMAVSVGSVTPKSASTPRGSLTARERYGADLYQTGGSPSTSQG